MFYVNKYVRKNLIIVPMNVKGFAENVPQKINIKFVYNCVNECFNVGIIVIKIVNNYVMKYAFLVLKLLQ